MLQKCYFVLWLSAITLTVAAAQQASFSGTYINANSTIGLRFKPMGNEYHGLVQTNLGNFAFRGKQDGQQMTGTLYTADGPVNFSATLRANALVFSAFGYTDNFYQTSPQHELGAVDLSQYMISQGSTSQTPPDPSQDFDYSYSQHNRGHATEQRQTYPNQSAPAASPHPALNDRELFNLVAGSQVVYYTRTSYLNDNVASSITYVNFCRDGRFWMNYDGSFSVEGGYGDNAQGASYGRNSGSWQLVTYQGQPAVFLSFNNGNTSVNPVNKGLILQGRWRVGNTQYAVQRNKVRCN